MPQGSWNCPPVVGGAEGDRGRPAGRRWRSLRPTIALSVLALLAGCGQTVSDGGGAVAVHSGYQRPTSYDPPGPPGDPWGPWIREASRRFDIPERWIREVMRQESAGRATATSHAGAMGLMQVMPGTYRELRRRYGLGPDPYHPYDSIMAGTAYLREMYNLFGSPAFLAAYNAGPRRLEDYLWNSRGLPGETRNYVARIGPRIIGTHPNRRAPPEIYAAAEIPLRIPPGPRRMDSGTMLALREQRRAAEETIQIAQLPPGPVVRMDPIPDGSTTPPVAYQLASAGPVVRMDPIPDGSTPEGAEQLAIAERRAAAGIAASEAAAPSPAPRTPPATRTALAAASPPARPAPPAVAPGTSRGFGLVASARASTLPASLRPPPKPTTRPEPARGGTWAVQVGAFSSEKQARSTAGAARRAAGNAGVMSVQRLGSGRQTLYRARVVGLTQASAQQACERMRRNGACILLSPDAQRS